MKPINITADEFELLSDESGRKTLRWKESDGWHSVQPKPTESISITVTSPDGKQVARINQTPHTTLIFG
jgi:hypothetical protein